MAPELLRPLLLVAALAVATAVALVLRRRNGRARAVPAGDVLAASDLGAALGDRATFVQFSTSVCAPCRATKRVLGDLVADLPGVGHVEVDAEQRLDLARRFSVVRTPTVLLVDPDGRVVSRASGAMTRPQALAAVAPLLDPAAVRQDAAAATGGTR